MQKDGEWEGPPSLFSADPKLEGTGLVFRDPASHGGIVGSFTEFRSVEHRSLWIYVSSAPEPQLRTSHSPKRKIIVKAVPEERSIVYYTFHMMEIIIMIRINHV